MLYLFPDNSNDPQLVIELTNRANIPLISGSPIHSIISELTSDNHVVALVSNAQLAVLLYNPAELLVQNATLVTDCPDFVYTGTWLAAGGAFPRTAWVDFQKQFAQTGNVAFDKKDLGKRAIQSGSNTLSIPLSDPDKPNDLFKDKELSQDEDPVPEV